MEICSFSQTLSGFPDFLTLRCPRLHQFANFCPENVLNSPMADGDFPLFGPTPTLNPEVYSVNCNCKRAEMYFQPFKVCIFFLHFFRPLKISRQKLPDRFALFVLIILVLVNKRKETRRKMSRVRHQNHLSCPLIFKQMTGHAGSHLAMFSPLGGGRVRKCRRRHCIILPGGRHCTALEGRAYI